MYPKEILGQDVFQKFHFRIQQGPFPALIQFQQLLMAALSQGGKSKQKQRQEKGKKFHGKGILVLLKNRILTYTKRIKMSRFICLLKSSNLRYSIKK
jgi:hypothetical protein